MVRKVLIALFALAVVSGAVLVFAPIPINVPLLSMLLGGDRSFADRQHFFRVAAEAMRPVLVDRARRRGRVRHGGDRSRVGLSRVASVVDTPADDLLALDAALKRFSELAPQKAELVKLRYFAGLSEQDAADALGISRATASRYWTFSRAWLIQAMEDES